jgi:hypothetical protein
MARRPRITLASTLAAAVLLAPAVAQEAAKPETPKAQPEILKPETRRTLGPTLRVQVVLTRFQGEKKLASLPYTFTATVDGRPVRMRMGVDTPVAVAQTAGSPMTSFQYRNVGTNIDCSASDAGEGRYRLMLTVENSSALTGEMAAAGMAAGGNPMFRRFDSNIDPVLRDGQSVQTIASTDPVTGEVVKIDVTMNVVK